MLRIAFVLASHRSLAMKFVHSAFLVMTAAMPATGCGDEVGPSTSIFGTYTLQTVNGQTIPFGLTLGSRDGTSTITVETIDGSFRLNSDNTWSSSLTRRTTRNGNVTDTIETEEMGTFARNSGSFQFMRDNGGAFTGSVSANTLTVVIPRAQPAVILEDIMVYTK